MNTWPNRGASGGPCGGLEDNEAEQSREVSPSRSDSSQQASSKPGAVQLVDVKVQPLGACVAVIGEVQADGEMVQQ